MGRTLIRCCGFTVIEILIMVLLLGILAMAGMPLISSTLGHGKLSSAVSIMVAGIEYTANLSVRYQRLFQFQADVNTNSIKIQDTAPYPDATASIRPDNQPPVNAENIVLNPVTRTWYQVDLSAIGNIEGVSIDSGPAVLSFYPDGHSTDSSSSFADTRYVLSFGGLSKTITINRVSGRVTVD